MCSLCSLLSCCISYVIFLINRQFIYFHYIICPCLDVLPSVVYTNYLKQPNLLIVDVLPSVVYTNYLKQPYWLIVDVLPSVVYTNYFKLLYRLIVDVLLSVVSMLVSSLNLSF